MLGTEPVSSCKACTHLGFSYDCITLSLAALKLVGNICTSPRICRCALDGSWQQRCCCTGSLFGIRRRFPFLRVCAFQTQGGRLHVGPGPWQTAHDIPTELILRGISRANRWSDNCLFAIKCCSPFWGDCCTVQYFTPQIERMD